jgi:hypothetical protein
MKLSLFIAVVVTSVGVLFSNTSNAQATLDTIYVTSSRDYSANDSRDIGHNPNGGTASNAVEVSEIARTDSGFRRFLQSVLERLGILPREVNTNNLCGNSELRHITSVDDVVFRSQAATLSIGLAIANPINRLVANGSRIRVTYADGGSEQYIYSSHVSQLAPLPGTLVLGGGIPNQGC